MTSRVELTFPEIVQDQDASRGHLIETIGRPAPTIIVTLPGYGMDPHAMTEAILSSTPDRRTCGLTSYYLEGFKPEGFIEDLVRQITRSQNSLAVSPPDVIIYAQSYGASLAPLLIEKLIKNKVSIRGILAVAPLFDRSCLAPDLTKRDDRFIGRLFSPAQPIWRPEEAVSAQPASALHIISTVPQHVSPRFVEQLNKHNIPCDVITFRGDQIVDTGTLQTLLIDVHNTEWSSVDCCTGYMGHGPVEQTMLQRKEAEIVRKYLSR